jgi:hypothetical protein
MRYMFINLSLNPSPGGEGLKKTTVPAPLLLREKGPGDEVK